MFGKKKDQVIVEDINGKSYSDRLKKSYLTVAVAYVIFGACLALKPQISSDVICFVVGILCAIYAITALLKYFTSDVKRMYIEPSFILAVIMAVAAIVFIIRPDIVISILPFVLGIIVVISGIVKLQDAIALKKAGYEKWGVVSIFPIVSLVFGILMLINPFGTGILFIRIVGIFFIIDGAMSITSNILSKKYQ